ncbi:hypothetical protein J6590_022353 [Homalodisca vitripennis]|nr:hypothetical protein J6590_022353 [Homalodisca vitripennis]
MLSHPGEELPLRPATILKISCRVNGRKSNTALAAWSASFTTAGSLGCKAPASLGPTEAKKLLNESHFPQMVMYQSFPDHRMPQQEIAPYQMSYQPPH